MKALEIKDKLAIGVSDIYILSGDDYYLKSYALEQIKQLISPQDFDFSYDVFEEEIDINAIIDACNTPTFGGGQRVVVVKNISKQLSKQETNNLLDYAINPNERTILVFIDCGNFINSILDYAVYVDCKKATEYEISRYITTKFQQKNCKMSSEGIRLIIKNCDSDMGKITQEINKILMCFARQDGDQIMEINESDLQYLLSPDTETKIFELTNALQKNQKQQALEIYYMLIKRGEKANFIFSTLMSAYRRYLQIAISTAPDNVLSKTLSLSMSALSVNKKIIENSKKSIKGYIPKLKKTVDYLYELEYNYKSGQLSVDNALDLAMTWLIAQ